MRQGYNIRIEPDHEQVLTPGYAVGKGNGEEIARSIDRLEDTISDKKENSMNDIAGLLALMQNNKNMDLPGMLALCKDKGYDRSFGGEGLFLFVFLLLFLFNGGGWGNLGRNNQEAFSAMAGTNCQTITGLYDRISAAQATSAQGFQQLDTNLCSSIATVLASVRDQGDRGYDATRNVGDTVRDCCCKLEAQLAGISCEINGLGRDVRDLGGQLTAKIELEALKQENARAAMECRLSQQQKDCCCETQAAIADLKATIAADRLMDENARLRRENDSLRETARGDATANAVVNALQTFAMNHWNPTRTTPAAGGAA